MWCPSIAVDAIDVVVAASVNNVIQISIRRPSQRTSRKFADFFLSPWQLGLFQLAVAHQ
jgi:hypothetical protein